MPIAPLITFKAGQCEVQTDSKPYRVIPKPEPGYLYLFTDDDLTHFCWRKRDEPLDSPTLDLVMIPTDASFIPYEHNTESQPSAKTNGRIFVLKFTSSSQRHLFWLQSKPQGRNGDPRYFSPRDRKIGDLVNRMLQGEEVNVTRELQAVRNTDDRQDDDGDDEHMEDANGPRERQDRHGSASGGAGPGATGGDVREEGEESREGGADGARAADGQPGDATAAVQNLLASLRGHPELGGAQGGGHRRESGEIPYPHLTHLLPMSVTVPVIDGAAADQVDGLLVLLPPAVLVLASSPDSFDNKVEPSADAVAAAKASLSMEDKRTLLRRVVRSPQFYQALGSMTMALRDGGLPGISDALGIKVENGGYLPGAGLPMGGGQAVQAFVDGVKKAVRDSEAGES